MMSAADLLKFAGAHMRGGTDARGGQLLSRHGATLMQEITVDNRSRTYADANVGLGWMITDDGVLMHGGGGPGLISWLYAIPKRNAAAVVLTNSDNGWQVIADLMDPWLRAMGSSTRANGLQQVSRSATERDEAHLSDYVGSYEAVGLRFEVSQRGAGIAMTMHSKFAIYDSTRTKSMEPVALIPIGRESFLIAPAGDHPFQGLPEAFRVVAFLRSSDRHIASHLGIGGRLYKRV